MNKSILDSSKFRFSLDFSKFRFRDILWEDNYMIEEVVE